MKITVTFEIEIAPVDDDAQPSPDDVLNAMIECFHYPSLVTQPGVEDGWHALINNAQWSVEEVKL